VHRFLLGFVVAHLCSCSYLHVVHCT
jgi:hypothetical protein